MTNPMLERVAKAIEREIGKQEMLLTDPITLRRLMAKRAARAAIEAMREPTYEIVEAGAIAASSNDVDFRVDDVIPYDECDNCFRAEWRGEVAAAFDAMIDAALSEDKE